MSIDPCGKRLLRELSLFRSHSFSCELVVVVVLCMTALEVWECLRSSSMKCFFQAAWGKAWRLVALFLWIWHSSPPNPCFRRRLWAGAANSILLFMLEIDSRAFECRCFFFCMLTELEPVGMWARIVHSIPPLLGFSYQLHSRLNWSFNRSLCLRTFSSNPVAMCCINSSMANLEDQSSPPSLVILMPIRRLGRAWFLKCISTSFWGPFSLVSTGQTPALQRSALARRGGKEGLMEFWIRLTSFSPWGYACLCSRIPEIML
jgi:hypothetical protein